MQSCDIPESIAHRLALRERVTDAWAELDPLRSQLIDAQRTRRIREFFSGDTDHEIYRKMDGRRAELEALGATNFFRTKIGRNATCPCGSGLKFKKCCLARAS